MDDDGCIEDGDSEIKIDYKKYSDVLPYRT